MARLGNAGSGVRRAVRQPGGQRGDAVQLGVQGAAGFSPREAPLEASLEASRKLKLAAPWFFL